MSAAQFIERLYGDLPELFKDEDELIALWRRPDTRKKLLERLAEKGYGVFIQGLGWELLLFVEFKQVA